MNQNVHTGPTDAQFTDHVLGSRRRRHAVLALAERASQTSLADLATAVGARETDREPEQVPMGLAKRIQVTLHHTHLPRLADSGIVEYDVDAKMVAPRRIDDVVSVIRALDDAEGQ